MTTDGWQMITTDGWQTADRVGQVACWVGQAMTTDGWQTADRVGQVTCWVGQWAGRIDGWQMIGSDG
ncbi:MAG: hypothetical protein ACREMY_02350 [bacterium]